MPSWSLFFELFVSVSYALFRPRGKILFATLLVSLLLLALETPPSLPAIQFPHVVFCFYSGAALCRLWRSGALRFSSRTAILAPALVIFLCLIPLSGLGYMIALIMGVPLIVALSSAIPRSLFLRGAFLMLGEISYPLYAIHMPAFSLMRLATNSLTGSDIETEPSLLAKLLLAVSLLLPAGFLPERSTRRCGEG